MMQGAAAGAEESPGKHQPFPATVGENSVLCGHRDHSCSRHKDHDVYRGVYICVWCIQESAICAEVHSVCRGPRCEQGSIVCVWVHAVFRYPWCVEMSIVYEEVSIYMYRCVLGLVSRAVRGLCSHIHAMCIYDLCMYGIHSMVRGQFSHV